MRKHAGSHHETDLSRLFIDAGMKKNAPLPPPLVEWIVWANLDNYRSPELILLKGHLLIELLLLERLIRWHSYNENPINNLSFHRKLLLLEREAINAGERQHIAISLARKLNLLRNQLAHEFHFKSHDTALSEWANEVLYTLPSTKHQRYTPKTRLTQAIATVARFIYATDDEPCAGT